MNSQQLIESLVVYDHHTTAFKVFLTLLYIVTASLIVFSIVMRRKFKKRNSDLAFGVAISAIMMYMIVGFGLLATGISTPNDEKTVEKFVKDLSTKTGYTALSTSEKMQNHFIDNYKDYNDSDKRHDVINLDNSYFRVQVISKNNQDAYCYLKPAKLIDNSSDDPSSIRMIVTCTDNSKRMMNRGY